MSQNNNYGIDRRKRCWRDYVNMEKPLEAYPIIIDIADKGKYLPSNYPFPSHTNKKERIEWTWALYNWEMENLSWLDDDNIPCLYIHTGTEIFAEAFGCSVNRPVGNFPHAIPYVKNVREAEKIKIPTMDCKSVSILFEMMDELRMRAGKDSIVRLPDIQSPMDIVAQIWEKGDLYMSCIDEPDVVKELADKVKCFLTTFLDEWFERYGSEFIAHWPNYYMEKGISLTADEVGIISPEMFEEFFLPELKELSERYGGIGIHCCASARHQWENFLKVPNLKVFNITNKTHISMQDMSLLEYFSCKVPLFTEWNCTEPSWEWRKAIPDGARNVIQVTAQNKEEAKEICSKLWHTYK